MEIFCSIQIFIRYIKILEPISEKIILIDGNTDKIDSSSKNVEIKDIDISLHYLKDIKPSFYSAILWIIKCILAQIKTSFELVKARNEIDIVLFYLAYPYYLLPLVTAKIFKKKTIEVLTRSKPNYLISKIISLQDPILFRLLDGISPEFKALINSLNLEKYRNKLLPEGSRFVNISFYIPKKKLTERKNIGFIGRIRAEKGVVEFVKAIPLIIKESKNIEFDIVASKESPVVNPAFVIRDWGKNDLSLKINGQKKSWGKDFRYGHVNHLKSSDLVVWMRYESTESVEITLSPRGM